MEKHISRLIGVARLLGVTEVKQFNNMLCLNFGEEGDYLTYTCASKKDAAQMFASLQEII